MKAAATNGSPLLVTAPFLSARAQEVLVELGASYADATGNMRLALERPSIFLETRGADRDPTRERRPLKSLKGPAAGRVVRALCDFVPPYGVRTLAERSSTPLGTVSRVVNLLDQELLLKRDDAGRVVDVDWLGLLRRWSRDYDVKTSNRLFALLEPRGLSELAEKLRSWSGRYAWTGSMAASRIAAPRLATIYVDNAGLAAEQLALASTDAGANVWLLEPYDDVVFERTRAPGFSLEPGPEKALVCAAPSQVAIDLMTGPGRGPQEAEALLERMQRAEDEWRHRL